MSDRKTPPELDDAELAGLYRESAQEVPPAELDEQILQAAREQSLRVAANGAPRQRATWLTGRLPAALASAAVLVVTIAVVARYEEPVPAAVEAPLLEIAEDRAREDDSKLAKTAPADPAPAAAFEGVSRADFSRHPLTLKEPEPAPLEQPQLLASRSAERLSAAAATVSAAFSVSQSCQESQQGFCLDQGRLSVRQPSCADPFRLPETASAPVLSADGVVFMMNGEAQRFVCRDSVWETEPSAESPIDP